MCMVCMWACLCARMNEYVYVCIIITHTRRQRNVRFHPNKKSINTCNSIDYQFTELNTNTWGNQHGQGFTTPAHYCLDILSRFFFFLNTPLPCLESSSKTTLANDSRHLSLAMKIFKPPYSETGNLLESNNKTGLVWICCKQTVKTDL